jgi:integrase
MASLQRKGNGWYLQFLHRGKRHTFAVGAVSEEEATAKAARVEELLSLVKRGLVSVPAGIGIVEFLRHDGKPPENPRDEGPVPSPAVMNLGVLRDLYLATHEGSLEERTLGGIRLHFKHLASHLGERFPIRDLKLLDLQGYVEKRAKAKGNRGRTLSPATIRKELITLRTAWNWGMKMGHVSGRFPNEGLRYPKHDEKPPLQTREQIERQLPGATDAERADLWDALYLTLPEIEEVLEVIRQGASHPWIYPMACTAAHGGARRSELLRMRVADVDLAQGILRIREKKRARGRRTTRDVPLSPALAAVLAGWLAVHPGGQALFCHGSEVARSKKRSPTTGHRGEATRAKTEAGRLAVVGPQGLARLPPLVRRALRQPGRRPAAHRRMGRAHDRGDEAPLPAPLPLRPAAGADVDIRTTMSSAPRPARPQASI